MIDPSAVVAVILAAGLSRRFGTSDKLMADCRGQPLIAHVADLASSLPFRGVLAVCQAGSTAASVLRLRGATIEVNPLPQQGMGSSLTIGIGAAAKLDPEACLVLLGDMPDVTSLHLLALLAAFDPDNDIVTSATGGRRLPPVLFGRRHFQRLGEITGDEGARSLTEGARAVETTASVLVDIDVPADLQRLSTRPAERGSR